VAPAVTYSVTGLVGAATAQLNDAVTPAGTPDSVRLTFALLSPIGFAMPIVVDVLLPPTKTERVLGEEVTVKLEPGTVSAIVAALERVPETPVTVAT